MQNLNKDIIVEFLKKNKAYLHDKYGVNTIGLMGSFARDEQTPESDIDFIVEFTEVKFNFLAGLMIFLEKNFDRKIDIIRKRNGMRRSFLERTEKEAIYA